jgi:hypothetical protein
MVTQREAGWYDEPDDNTAYYVLCAYLHALEQGAVPAERLKVWSATLDQLHGPIRLHETARLLYFLTPFSLAIIGRLIDVPPFWLEEAFEPWDTKAGCGHPTKVTTRGRLKRPPKLCWRCGTGHLQQKLFSLPEPPMGWVHYHARFRRADWRLLRRRKLQDHPFCAVCHAAGDLDVHHNTYKRFGRERLEDLTVLCRPCHVKFHGEGHQPPAEEKAGSS